MKPKREVPSEFYSFESGKPFSHCIDCGCELLESEREYVVEKAVRNYSGYTAQDVIFDYAICMSCAFDMHQKMSEESKSAIFNYMNEKMQNKQTNIEDINLKNCAFTKMSAHDCTEYQIVAHCKGKHLKDGIMPFMVSGLILDELSDLISDETRDEMNRFVNEHFPTSPYLKEPDPSIFLF